MPRGKTGASKSKSGSKSRATSKSRSKTDSKSKSRTAGRRKAGARSRHTRREEHKGLTKPALKRLARRSGAKRVNGMVYDELRTITENYMEKILHDVAVLLEYSGHTTAAPKHLYTAMKLRGVHIAAGLNSSGRLVHFRGKRKIAREVPKSHRFRPGTVATREINQQQKRSDTLILQRVPFVKLTARIMAEHWGGDKKARFSAPFIDMLQFAVESKLVNLLQYSVKLAHHGRRQGVYPRDLQMAQEASV